MILKPDEVEKWAKGDDAWGRSMPNPEQFDDILDTLVAYAEIVRKVAEMEEPPEKILNTERYLAGFRADGPSEVPNPWHKVWLQARKLLGMEP